MKTISIKTTPKFEKSFSGLPKLIQKEAVKKKAIFSQNPFVPELKTHKLAGKLRTLWSFSINYSYRVLFEFTAKNKVLFHDVGTHRIYKRGE